jgi:hypothetical protein
MKQIILLSFTICLFSLAPNVAADFGGHDLFTSLAQLEVLWKNEREVVEDMKDIIKKLDRAKTSLEQ